MVRGNSYRPLMLKVREPEGTYPLYRPVTHLPNLRQTQPHHEEIRLVLPLAVAVGALLCGGGRALQQFANRFRQRGILNYVEKPASTVLAAPALLGKRALLI